jgi:predicted RNA binding protein YcfA (HicA-like mRNA interferase family)
MKIPRDMTGIQFAKLLIKYGYNITRQKGSHIRLTTQNSGEHHITIPSHDPLKVGTISSILSDVSNHFNLPKSQIMQELFD